VHGRWLVHRWGSSRPESQSEFPLCYLLC
jgi:hypothetical protein